MRQTVNGENQYPRRSPRQTDQRAYTIIVLAPILDDREET